MNWQPYIRASWEIVMECESRSRVHLDDELEAYLVYMVARNFRNRDFPPDVICLEFNKARTRDDFRQIGDSCLFVDAWDIRRAKLVGRDYYEKMGQSAYTYAASAARPWSGMRSHREAGMPRARSAGCTTGWAGRQRPNCG